METSKHKRTFNSYLEYEDGIIAENLRKLAWEANTNGRHNAAFELFVAFEQLHQKGYDALLKKLNEQQLVVAVAKQWQAGQLRMTGGKDSYRKAIALYTEAIELAADDPILHTELVSQQEDTRAVLRKECDQSKAVMK